LHAFEEAVVLFLQDLFNLFGWGGVVVAMTIESACIPLPSEVTMPLSGWMLIAEPGLPMWHILLGGWWGAVGCTIGSVITYWIGAKGGRPFLLRYGRYVLISRRDIDMADRWFSRWGEATAFFSRLLPVIRTFISLPAGVARMNFAKFTALTFIGSFIWCTGLTWAGYAFGQHWREIRELMRPLDIPIIIAGILFVIWYLWRHFKHIREDAELEQQERERAAQVEPASE